MLLTPVLPALQLLKLIRQLYINGKEYKEDFHNDIACEDRTVTCNNIVVKENLEVTTKIVGEDGSVIMEATYPLKVKTNIFAKMVYIIKKLFGKIESKTIYALS